MAEEKKKASWSYDQKTGINTITMPDGTSQSFNLTEIFPDILSLDGNKQYFIQYGVKQVLSDEIAGKDRSVHSSKELIGFMVEKWTELHEPAYPTRTGGGARVSIPKAKFIEFAMKMGKTKDEAEVAYGELTKK